MVVAAGVAVGFCTVVLDRPPAGAQLYVYGPVPPAGVDVKPTPAADAHRVPPVAVTVGFALTVTVAVAVPVQRFASVTVTV